MGAEHKAWGVVTVVFFLVYFVVVIGWLVPLLWAIVKLVSPLLMQGKHVR